MPCTKKNLALLKLLGAQIAQHSAMPQQAAAHPKAQQVGSPSNWCSVNSARTLGATALPCAKPAGAAVHAHEKTWPQRWAQKGFGTDY